MVREDGENLVFLLSLPRSGSTLLSAVLGSHSAICCPPEPWFLLRLAEVVGWASADKIFDDYFASMGTRSFLPGEAFLESAREFALRAYNWHLKKEGRGVFVDKTPRYYHILDFIDALFPKAKKIWLRRDPLDVAASYKTSWLLGVDMLVGETARPASFDLTFGLHAYRKYFADASPQKYTVRYEDIVAGPEKAVKGICEFLGLPFEEKMLMYSENSRIIDAYGRADVGDRFVLKQHGFHSNSVGKWRTTFSKVELGKLLGVIGPDGLREMGYTDTARELEDTGVEAVSAGQGRGELAELVRKTSYGAVYDELRNLRTQYYRFIETHNTAAAELDELRARVDRLEAEKAGLEAEKAGLEAEKAGLENRLGMMDKNKGFENSLSWRVTEPFRRAAGVARKLKPKPDRRK